MVYLSREVPEDNKFEFGRWKVASKEEKPIICNVIGKKENEGYLLLISDTVLDAMQYASNMKEITWPKSDIRRFLNKSIYYGAFNESEKKIIIPICMDSKQAEEFKDNVFCLSSDEYSKYMPELQDRTTKFTLYAEHQIGRRKKQLIWTRDNGQSLNGKKVSFNMVDCIGNIITADDYLNKAGGIRPALWIDIS